MTKRFRFPVVQLMQQSLEIEEMIRDGRIEIREYRRTCTTTVVGYRQTPSELQVTVSHGSDSQLLNEMAATLKQLLVRWQNEGEAALAIEATVPSPPGKQTQSGSENDSG